jgi:hypothetical protein
MALLLGPVYYYSTSNLSPLPMRRPLGRSGNARRLVRSSPGVREPATPRRLVHDRSAHERWSPAVSHVRARRLDRIRTTFSGRTHACLHRHGFA